MPKVPWQLSAATGAVCMVLATVETNTGWFWWWCSLATANLLVAGWGKYLNEVK